MPEHAPAISSYIGIRNAPAASPARTARIVRTTSCCRARRSSSSPTCARAARGRRPSVRLDQAVKSRTVAGPRLRKKRRAARQRLLARDARERGGSALREQRVGVLSAPARAAADHGLELRVHQRGWRAGTARPRCPSRAQGRRGLRPRARSSSAERLAQSPRDPRASVACVELGPAVHVGSAPMAGLHAPARARRPARARPRVRRRRRRCRPRRRSTTRPTCCRAGTSSSGCATARASAASTRRTCPRSGAASASARSGWR